MPTVGLMYSALITRLRVIAEMPPLARDLMRWRGNREICYRPGVRSFVVSMPKNIMKTKINIRFLKIRSSDVLSGGHTVKTPP